MSSHDDDDDDGGLVASGQPNYMTPASYEALRSEAEHYLKVERPEVTRVVQWAASNGDRSENADYQYGKRRLREIDRRLRYLTKRLESAVVVDPAAQTQRERVFFGATVRYCNAEGDETTVRIVGLDEADASRGDVSFISPVARVLLGKRVGDEVTLRSPSGVQTLEVLSVSYPSA